MKLPVLWLVAAFAAGIGLAGRWPGSLRLWLISAAVAILVSGILLWQRRVAAAWTFALTAWIALGAVATGIERSAVPANHVTRLLAAGRLDISDPVRWRGRLREDPMTLPWGRRYEIDLEQAEEAGEIVPVSGGLRVNLYGETHAADELQNLRAGDRVEALVKARPPRNFLDPGAFDLRGFLARQKIDLTGSLRSGELLQLIDRPRPTFLAASRASTRIVAGATRCALPGAARARGCAAGHAARRPQLR